jgi:hypothetical protein
MGEGCPERFFDREFPAFLKYIWEFPKDKGTEIRKKLSALKDEKTTFVLRSRKEIEQHFFAEISGGRKSLSKKRARR